MTTRNVTWPFASYGARFIVVTWNDLSGQNSSYCLSKSWKFRRIMELIMMEGTIWSLSLWSTGSEVPEGLPWQWRLKQKKTCSISAFSATYLSRVPVPFSRGHTFPLEILLLLTCLKNTLSWTCSARFNSKWTLGFLLEFLHIVPTSWCSSQVGGLCFYLMYLLLMYGFWHQFLVHPCRSHPPFAWLLDTGNVL